MKTFLLIACAVVMVAACVAGAILIPDVLAWVGWILFAIGLILIIVDLIHGSAKKKQC